MSDAIDNDLLPPADWDKQPLGEVRDTEIAARVNLSPSAVWIERHRRGVRAVEYPRHKIEWSNYPLGQVPDSEIAAELGVTRGVVAKARIEAGIPVFVNTRAGQRIQWEQQPLGKMSDRKLAKRINVSSSTVRCERLARGIPSVGESIDWSHEPLGEVPDRVISERLGVTEELVRRARHDRGIPVSTEQVAARLRKVRQWFKERREDRRVTGVCFDCPEPALGGGRCARCKERDRLTRKKLEKKRKDAK